jgi:hypothetical protein
MAIHLLLLSFNKVWPELGGEVHIYSDCLGALNKVKDLPPRRIPSKCRHADILKNILVNFSDLTFTRIFSHVKAHQDDAKAWEEMERPAQLNCGCDHGAKDEIYSTIENGVGKQQELPLEPLVLFVGGEKVTTESSSLIRFEAHKKEARSIFHERKVLDPLAFDEVAWRHVHRTMHDLPRMFRIFACKQVFGISAVNHFVNKRDKTVSPKCPCCLIADETTKHILLCREEGRIQALHQLSARLLHSLNDIGTPRDLTFLIVKYIRERGTLSMEQLVRYHDLPPEYIPFAKSQDQIGWCRFLEGMVSGEIVALIESLGLEDNPHTSVDKWMSLLITQLLELTHGLWIYRCLVIHDPDTGVLAIRRKEALQLEIEKQIALGGEV